MAYSLSLTQKKLTGIVQVNTSKKSECDVCFVAADNTNGCFIGIWAQSLCQHVLFNILGSIRRSLTDDDSQTLQNVSDSRIELTHVRFCA